MAGPSPSLDLFEETRRLLLALERREVEYALVGAVALAVHGAWVGRDQDLADVKRLGDLDR